MTDKSPRALQTPLRTEDLTPQQCSLLEIMHVHQFGRIENITVRDGELVFEGHIKVVRLVRLGAGNGGKKTLRSDEFELKKSVRDLFAEMARVENGTVIRVEFRHGLPFLLEMTIECGPA